MKRKLCVLLCFVLVLVNLQMPTSATELINSEPTYSDEDAMVFQKDDIFYGDGFNITFNLMDSWTNGYNAVIKIENTSDTNIENWILVFDYDGEISNIWNANIISREGTTYTIKNAEWNQDIGSGQTVEFGISGQGEFHEAPYRYRFVSTLQEKTDRNYNIEYKVESDWGSGFTANITITNNSDETLEDWILEFDYSRSITHIWNAELLSYDGNHYVIKNAGYNANIPENQSISFGFNGEGGSINDEPENCAILSYTIENTNSTNNQNETNEEIDVLLDTDGDGAPDFLEKYYGTDINVPDTDGDDLSDFYELYSVSLNPLSPDTDGNGIEDSEEDTDGDGIPNIVELSVGSSLVKPDTDNDGLSDNDEYEIYGTDLNNHDTDSDGASDKEEIDLGYNPLENNETFSITKQSSEQDTVDVSVNMALCGDQVKTLSVRRFESDFLFPENMPGYICGAYEFNVEGDFDEATIKFVFDSSLLDDDSFDPVIYYFNEDEQTLEEIETTVIGNEASARVNHFSKYILLNRKTYQNSLEWQDVWSSTGFNDTEVVFVIDDSDWNCRFDRNYDRVRVARELVDTLPDNCNIGIVKFDRSPQRLTPSLSTDKEYIKDILDTNNFFSYGRVANIYLGIQMGFGFFNLKNDRTQKVIVLLTDGIADDEDRYESILERAKNNNITIYTVGYGGYLVRSYVNLYLRPIAEETGGEYFAISDAEKLGKKLSSLGPGTISYDIETDSDSDGIPDYYEDNMVLFNGIIIRLDKDNPDTDGDGISDGEEIAKLDYKYNEDYSKVIVTGRIISNPLEQDSDGDGISDGEEMYIGTDPLYRDTDRDGLEDGMEAIEGFDPLDADPDGDGINDFMEYVNGTDPYVYNKEWYDYLWDFSCGFVAGDFIHDTDSLATVFGQLVSGFIPFVDARDVVANIAYGDYGFASLSAVGLVFDASNVAKSASKAGKAVLKNIDEVPKVAELIEFMSKNCPEVLEVLGKTDDFAEAAKRLSKLDSLKLTRAQMKILTKAFEDAGLSHYLLKTSSGLNIEGIVNTGAEIWEGAWLKRGFLIEDKLIDPIRRIHLGTNFPIVDFYDKSLKAVISTKSIDIAANSYQDTKKLEKVLVKYANLLAGLDDSKYFKGTNRIVWGDVVLNKADCSRKILEIVVPDTIITENALKTLVNFQADWAEKGIEVVYKIAK